jgi:tetratricopeptide (TPR) repeat protein
MYKVCLTGFCWLLCFGALAQSSSFTPQVAGPAGLSINIAVSNDDEADGDSYFAEAELNEKRGDLNDALTLFGKAAFEYNSSKKFNAYGAALLKLSNIHLMLNNLEAAEQVILNVALKNYSRIGSRLGQMDSYQQLGKVYYASNKLTQSLWFYTQQGIVARQLKNNPAYIDSMLGIIKIKIKKKEYNMALKDVNKAELFARSNKVYQYNAQFKSTRSLLKGKIVPKSKRI